MFPKRAVIALLALLITACSNPGVIVPNVHKINIQQGNVVTHESLEKISIGMSKRQVSLILGMPFINDPFHNDRWDYVYTLTLGHNETEKNQVTIVFDNDTVSQVIAEINSDFYTDTQRHDASSVTIDVPPRPPENRTLVQKVTNFFTF